jgi:hypothetical protein
MIPPVQERINVPCLVNFDKMPGFFSVPMFIAGVHLSIIIVGLEVTAVNALHANEPDVSLSECLIAENADASDYRNCQ